MQQQIALFKSGFFGFGVPCNFLDHNSLFQLLRHAGAHHKHGGQHHPNPSLSLKTHAPSLKPRCSVPVKGEVYVFKIKGESNLALRFLKTVAVLCLYKKPSRLSEQELAVSSKPVCYVNLSDAHFSSRFPNTLLGPVFLSLCNL